MMDDPRIALAWPTPELDVSDDRLAELYTIDDRERPWLRVNFVSSLDGAATRDGRSGGLSSASDKRVFDVLRRLCDVVMVGAGTVRVEGYGPMRLDDDAAGWRELNGLPPQPAFAIVSGSLNIDQASRVFSDAPVRPIVLTTTRASDERASALRRVADVVVCGDDSIDADVARRTLLERGLAQILCEGGPALFGSILAADGVDELCLTLSPSLEAGDAGRIARGALPSARSLTLRNILVATDAVLLRYSRANGG